MILRKSSILQNLPVNLNKRQFLILDSMRFAVEIIENSWTNLITGLRELSNIDSNKVKNLPKLYIEAWSIIDNSHRLRKLHSQLNIENQHDLMNSIKHVGEVRHTYQHLDERIDESFIDSDMPFYGILTWNFFNSETNKVEPFLTSSGIACHNLDFKYDVTKFDINKAIDNIDNIKLDTIIRKKENSNWIYKRTSIDLSELIANVKLILEKFEKYLEEQLKIKELELADWSSRKDIVIRMKS